MGADNPADVVITHATCEDPQETVARLFGHWVRREPVTVSIACDIALLREPSNFRTPPWDLDASFLPWRDILYFLLFANNVDERGDDPVWWQGRRALRDGAGYFLPAADDGDVVTSQGDAIWIDGGPRRTSHEGDASILHCSDVVRVARERSLRRNGETSPSGMELAADQMAAVHHGVGPACVIAPAGSGKTRVIVERLRYLTQDCGYDPNMVVALAYNTRARGEMVSRLPSLESSLRTINSLTYEIAREARPGAQVMTSRQTRTLLESCLGSLKWRNNVDALAPYLEGLGSIRLGLVRPEDFERDHPDLEGIANATHRYRQRMKEEGLLDFDEQVYAAVEYLLANGSARRRWQDRVLHLIVDEFQDVRPLHMLLFRLLAAPQMDVFVVGDDDQVIYGYDGATPRYLTHFSDYFFGGESYLLSTNYRCPPDVVAAAGHLLSHNSERVPKTIAAGRRDEKAALHVVQVPAASTAMALSEEVANRLSTHLPAQVAILARINATLLVPLAALASKGIPVRHSLTRDILERKGTAAMLGYIELATASRTFRSSSLAAVVRVHRPSLPRWFPERLAQRSQWSVADLRAIHISDERGARSRDQLCDLIEALRTHAGVATSDLILAIREATGVDVVLSGGEAPVSAERSTHHEDLVTLHQAATLHPDAASFGSWLEECIATPSSDDGVTLSSVHRVKGMEWPIVIVLGATEGGFPHGEPACDLEEERRIFHVAMTRGIEAVTVMGSQQRPSRFVGEMSPVGANLKPHTGGQGREDLPHIDVAEGMRVEMDDGVCGVVRKVKPTTFEVMAGGGQHRRYDRGAVGAVDGQRGALVPVASVVSERTGSVGPSNPLEVALWQWRTNEARERRIPAYMVFNNETLIAIAQARPRSLGHLSSISGVGPKKLAQWGETIVEVVRNEGAIQPPA